ncbi:hypothetical protein JHK85_000122 [Glycine max]|nr:hypothetical protein JHK85_000122 [Glycine max]KAG5087509.1 hypothetical protein JHK86_000121 [Glycine max]
MKTMMKFNLDTIRVARSDFSDSNKLGEGGFGTVYQGKLSNGQVFAFKRLSRNSSQGDLEFKNEVILLAKLQHQNLVWLLGFCLEGREKLLVYEFVPNKSLDYLIFADIWHLNGHFSVKSDVFSFGVLVLAIVSVKRIHGICHEENGENLFSFINPSLNNNSQNEMIRCIHIGLLFVQENLVNRPTMAMVALPSKPEFSMDSATRSLPNMSWEVNSGVTPAHKSV